MKKINIDKKDNGSQVNDGRRKAVRNLLASAGVTAGISTVAGKSWVEPVINTVVLPAHAQTSDALARCCPYYYDATQMWCYDDGAAQNGNTGPVANGFSVYNWDQPANCPTPDP